MFCNNCGVQLPDRARFCPACGVVLQRSTYGASSATQQHSSQHSVPSGITRFENLRISHATMARGAASWIPIVSDLSARPYFYIDPASKVNLDWFKQRYAGIEIEYGKVGRFDGPPQGVTVWFNNRNFMDAPSSFESYLMGEGWEPYHREEDQNVFIILYKRAIIS